MLSDLLSKSWHPIIKDTEASTKRVLYQNFDLGVGFIPLYIIGMAQIIFIDNTGNILTPEEDGVHLGKGMVSGSWDGPVINTVMSVADVSGSLDYLIYEAKEYMTSSLSSLDSLSYFNITTSALETSSQSNLSASGRTPLSKEEFLGSLVWTEGFSEQILKDIQEGNA